MPWEEGGLGYGDPETSESRSGSLQLGNLDEGRESKQIQKNIDIKPICVEEEEEEMDSKGRVTLVFPKARIIIKKNPS